MTWRLLPLFVGAASSAITCGPMPYSHQTISPAGSSTSDVSSTGSAPERPPFLLTLALLGDLLLFFKGGPALMVASLFSGEMSKSHKCCRPASTPCALKACHSYTIMKVYKMSSLDVLHARATHLVTLKAYNRTCSCRTYFQLKPQAAWLKNRQAACSEG